MKERYSTTLATLDSRSHTETLTRQSLSLGAFCPLPSAFAITMLGIDVLNGEHLGTS